MKKAKEKINHSLSSSSSSIYYSNMSMPQIKKYDSGFSETTTTLSSIQQDQSILEQILSFERIYYESLKEYIIKYSRPLRRYLNPDEIVDLFQNIEKVSLRIWRKIQEKKFFFVSDFGYIGINCSSMWKVAWYRKCIGYTNINYLSIMGM